MRRLTRGLVAALEQEEIAAAAQAAAPAVAEEAPAAPLVDHSDTVETGLMEIGETEAAAAQVDEQTDAAVDVATALESMAECLKNAAGNGGLNKDGALAVTIAADALCRQVGITTVRRRMPSLESYGSVSSRVAATQLAMETFAEQAKKIWEAIIEAIKKSITWLVERWQLFFGTAAKVKERAEAVIAEAKKLTGEAKVKELDKGGLLKALHVGGKFDAASIMTSAGNLAGIGKSVYAGAETRVEGMAAAASTKDLKKVQQILHDLTTAPGTSGYHQVEAKDGLKLPEGADLAFRSEELPGGKVVLSVTSKEAGDTVEGMVKAMRASSLSVVDLGSSKAPEEGKLATLSAADIEKMAGIVVEFCGVIAGFQDGLKKVTEAKKKAVAEAEKFAKAEGATEEEQKNSKAFAQMLASVGKMVDNPIAGFSSYSINVGKSMLDYCTASVHAYSEDAGKSLADKAGDMVDKVKDKVGLGEKKDDKAAPAAAAA